MPNPAELRPPNTDCQSVGSPIKAIVERFHKTFLDEFYRIAFRKKVYDTIAELQADLDLWIDE